VGLLHIDQFVVNAAKHSGTCALVSKSAMLCPLALYAKSQGNRSKRLKIQVSYARHASDRQSDFNTEHVQDKARMGTNNETHCLNVRQTV